MRILCFYAAFTMILLMLVVNETAGQKCSVSGKVTDGTEPLPGATVILGGKTAIADSKGEFSFLANAETNKIIVSYAGYRKVEQQVTIIADSINHFDFVLQPLSAMENIIIVGSRSQTQRSNLSTPVPVDLLQIAKLPERQIEMTKVIANYIPSFNAAPHGFLTGRHMLPASLRGLGPDQTLVLLNGKRRHTNASPWTAGANGFGTVGTDLNAIPFDAIEKVEVLRDGASAQYGSDAIAGVIHLRLKESTGITSIRLNMGQYYEGDGETLSFGINHGFKFLNKGFLNTTAHFRYSNYTQRNGRYDGSVYYTIPNSPSAQRDSLRILDNKKISERGFSRLNHRPLGDNRVYNTAIAVNGGYQVSKSTSFYLTSIFNYRFVKDISSNLYRYPKDSARSVNMKLYPDGFLPGLESKFPDISAICGAKGITKSNWHWDAGSVFGTNSAEIIVTNTNNASQYLMGAAAPTRFNTGKQIFTQLTNNVTFSRSFSKGPGVPRSVHLAAGGEWRIEQYKIKEGEEASWKNYAPNTTRAGGAQGLGGFQPENEIDKSRHVLGSFVELELEKNKKLLINLAGRFEYYSDYGSNIAGKIAVAYKIFKYLSWRGSVSNGYRAPALQQRYYSQVTSVSRQSTHLYRNGTFRNNSEIASAFGIAKLKPEKAVNISTGFTSAPAKNLSITVDGYWIQIQDRIIYSGSLADGYPEVKHVLDSFQLFDIESVRFFANSINTRTMGVDLVFNGRWFLGKSLLSTTLAININRTEIYDSIQFAKNLPDSAKFQSLLLNREERCRVEDAYPKNKLILNIDYRIGKWTIHPAFTRYGKVTQRQNNQVNNPDQTYSPKIISSLNLRFDVNPWLALTAGGENIFDVYPDKVKEYNNTANGLLPYSPNFAPFGLNGGYYFLAMNVHL